MTTTKQPAAKFMKDMGVEAYRSMPINFGPIKATVFGGPFKEYIPGQRRLVSVKMAAEIDRPHDISVPTEDFSVPTQADMRNGIHQAVQAILDGNDLYVGCMGGIGRTGLFMACLAKVMRVYNGEAGLTPVAYVRKHYLSHAVETEPQQEFVKDFDPSYAVGLLRSKLEPKEKIVEVPVTVYTFNPFAALMSFWGGKR